MAERDYNFKDVVLMEWGDITLKHLKTDIEHFTVFDKKLNPDFVTDLEKQVTQAYKDGGDILNITQLQEKTELVKKTMQECRTYFKHLKYWVLDVFPSQNAIQRQFGIGRFKDVTKNQLKMISYLEGLTETIQQHYTALETAEVPAELLKQPSVLAETLRNANIEQEQKKGTRTIDTEKRVDQLNALYHVLQKINAAADTVFEEVPAKRNLYRPPYKNKKKVVNEEEE
ncbi:hypothetical protein [Aquimarina muelleri]|uniref:Uncharacterized protein n=1 Tax=Aquimarina muelleri TaxID=279356 RepID=A0A918K018_9FLAO|nr:hypothetical protein [Aquimarina muelleri]MCX2764757.1 hypothetical protein [Aquimarina muelleri]GGX33754.1 hypothetical protein GCM10007384_38060 [Aquimarina muelleri]